MHQGKISSRLSLSRKWQWWLILNSAILYKYLRNYNQIRTNLYLRHTVKARVVSFDPHMPGSSGKWPDAVRPRIGPFQ